MVLIKNHVSKLLFAILFLSYSTVWASTRTHNDWLVKTCADNIELRLYESAYYFCNQALIKDSSNIEALYYRGISLMELGKEEAAQLDFTRLIQKDPMDYEALVQRANVYRRLGQFTLALADANKALILNPEFALSYSSRGAILQNMDRHGEAIADFTKAIELIPNEPRLYVARGIAYSKRIEIVPNAQIFADTSGAKLWLFSP